VAPFENPRDRRHRRSCGIIGALLARASPGDAARLGVYLRWGEAVRRLGDAGLLAGDLPEAIPGARKRLVAVADRMRPGKRLGFAVREPAGATD
jgi:hypothetical protein